jgi:hypothetical protein
VNGTLVSVLTVLGGVLAGVGTVLAVLYTKARNSRDDLRAAVRGEESLKSAADTALQMAQAAQAGVAGLHSEVAGLRDMVGALSSRASILESKMDVFWRNVAFDVSKILHSPHSGWEDLDTLLEKFRAAGDGGPPLSSGDMAHLETQLRDMVEGRWTPAEVTRADQVAASLLLRAIEQTRV